MTKFREELAEIEHDQWKYWTNKLLPIFEEWQEKGDSISDIEEMINYYQNNLYLLCEKWKKNHVDYNELPEVVKEFDRLWANKSIEVFQKKIDDMITKLDDEMISSKPGDDIKQFTIKEMKARQISKLEELKEVI